MLVTDVEDLPELGTDRRLVDLGHLRQAVAGAVDQTPLAACRGEHLVDRSTQSRRAVGDGEHRRAEPSGDHVLEEADARIGRFSRDPVQMQQHRVALGRDPVGDQHRLTSGPVVHLEVAGVDEQVVDRHVGQVADAPGVELLLDGITDPADGRLADRGVRAEQLA